MKNKQYIAMVALWFVCGVLVGQNERDAYRYAQYSPTGTARYSALAGSMGAFGADFTTLSANNPAGIGLFKRQMEITLTLAPSYNEITSTYNGVQRKEGKFGFNCNNFGLVFVSTISNSKWKHVQFATGINNLARYKTHSIVSGYNEGKTNFFDYVAESSYGTRINSLSGIALTAYDYYLIDPVYGKDDEYVNNVNDYFYQQQIRGTSGYLNEWGFSLGANYDDKLFLGATIGVPFFYYEEKTTYSEYPPKINDIYDNFEISDRLIAKATGINFKAGIIYQPAKFIRMGAAVHTPTIYPNVKETYYKDDYEFLNIYNHLDSVLDSKVYELSPEGRFDYQLTTPYRAMANVAFIINKYGFINLDYEFTDYSASHLQSNSYGFIDENSATKSYYCETHTIRAGGELNLSPIALRLGFSYSSNPYKNLDKDGSRYIISGGIGFKGKSFFADFAYMYKFTKDKDVFYDAITVNPYSSQIVNQVFALTLGWKLGK